jgi:hypothetical protein
MPEKHNKFNTAAAILAVLIFLGAAGYFLYTSPRGPFARSPDSYGNVDKTLPFPERIAQIAAILQWKHRPENRKLNRPTLLKSVELGKSFLIANQKTAGNFNYQYDFVKKTLSQEDNQVRQAGALWGLALLYRDFPDEATKEALMRGLDFFFQVTKDGREHGMFISYPGERECHTGTVALVTLAVIETLRAGTPPDEMRREQLKTYLSGYLAFLKQQQRPDGQFSMSYNMKRDASSGRTSPYYDGETLLALCKAARYLDRGELVPVIQKAARRMAEYYTVISWEKKKDSDETKGFYQWGSMAFREYSDSGWKDAKTFEDTALALAWWMVNTHRVLSSGRNSAYAYEGLVSAYTIAKKRNNQEALNELAYVIDRGLYRMTGWQVGGPLSKDNNFLSSHPADDKMAVGGIMNSKDESPLRIDVTQHQMHAVLLALQNVYME